jgi:hypothetical protein
MPQRTVRFYLLTDEHRQVLPNDLDFDAVLDAVEALPDPDAYVQLERIEVLGSTHRPAGAGAKAQVPLLSLDRITRDVRLRIERRRNYRPLALAADETLAEPTFYSILPRNVLAVMRNSGEAPGPASLRDYLNELELLDPPVGVLPLADVNAVRRLNEVDRLTKVDIAVGPDVAATLLYGSPTIAEAVRTVRQRAGRVKIELIISMTKASAAESETLLGEINALERSGALGEVERAKISYRRLEDGVADTYDFLNEAVAQAVEVDLEDANDVPTELSSSQAIARAYNEQYDDIMSALNAIT